MTHSQGDVMEERGRLPKGLEMQFEEKALEMDSGDVCTTVE